MRCPACCPAAARWATPPPARRSPRGVECRRAADRRRAATPTASWPPPRDGTLGALLIGGVEPADLPDPDAALAALDAAPFVVSLELRHSAVTERADVVFPVAPVAEKAGTFVNWEGRYRGFDPSALQTERRDTGPAGARLRWPTKWASTSVCRLRRSPATNWSAWAAGRVRDRSAPQCRRAAESPQRGPGEAVLAGWRMLLDDGPPAGWRTAPGRHRAHAGGPAVSRLPRPRSAPPTATRSPSAPRGAITLPLAVTDMPDRVVWLPLNSRSPAPTVGRNNRQPGADPCRRRAASDVDRPAAAGEEESGNRQRCEERRT